MFGTERTGWILYAWAPGILYRRMAPKYTTPSILFHLPFSVGCVLPGFETLVTYQWPFWEGESGYERLFLKEEGEACWRWLNSKDLAARVSWRHEKEWWNVRCRWVMERGRKWRQKEERCGWKGYTGVLWSPKVSPVAARGERLGCGLPLYPLTQWDSVWWTWGMLNDVRGGEGKDTGRWGGRKGGKVRLPSNMTTQEQEDPEFNSCSRGVCKFSPGSVVPSSSLKTCTLNSYRLV